MTAAKEWFRRLGRAEDQLWAFRGVAEPIIQTLIDEADEAGMRAKLAFAAAARHDRDEDDPVMRQEFRRAIDRTLLNAAAAAALWFLSQQGGRA